MSAYPSTLPFVIPYKIFSSFRFSHLVMSNSLCPRKCSTPGSPVLHQLLEFAQTYVHWVGDAIQPSNPLSPTSLPALNLSQHQGLFQWVSSSHQWPKYWSFFSFSISPSNDEYSGLISFRIDSLISLQEHSRVYSSTTVKKHQFFGAQPSLWSSSHMHTWLLEKP